MIIPVGFGQANLFFTGDDCPRGAQVTFGFSNDTPLSALDAAGVIAGIAASDLMPQFSSAVTLEQVKVKLGPNDTGDEALVAAGVAGSVSGDGYSPQVAALVVKQTALGGREGRGHMFLPGLYEGASTGAGRFAATPLSNWQDTVDSFLDDLSSAAVPMYLLHNSATAPTAVQALQVAPLFASQRRRIRKVGGRRPTP
jgi:hypothetical protein